MVSMIHGITVGVMDSVLHGAMVLAGVMDSMILSTTLGMIHGTQVIMAILIVMVVGMILGIMVITDIHIMVEDMFHIVAQQEQEIILLMVTILALLHRVPLEAHAHLMEVDLLDSKVLVTEVLEHKITPHVLVDHVL